MSHLSQEQRFERNQALIQASIGGLAAVGGALLGLCAVGLEALRHTEATLYATFAQTEVVTGVDPKNAALLIGSMVLAAGGTFYGVAQAGRADAIVHPELNQSV